MPTLETVLENLNRDPAFSVKYTVSNERINGGGSAVLMKGVRKATGSIPTEDIAVKLVAENLVLRDGVRYPIVGPGVFQRLKNEFEVLSGLQHPHIVRAYDFVQIDGVACIVMEYIDGPSLFQQLELGMPPQFTAQKIVAMLMYVAHALSYVHDQGIIHRDIKPSNIVTDAKSFNPRLIDFDIAAKVSHSVDEQRSGTSGTLRGTFGYMSSEQIRGLPPTPSMDIFSFGTLFYEVLTRRGLIFQKAGKMIMVDVDGYLNPPRYLPIQVQNSAFREIGLADDLVRKCCQVNPEDRYPSMGEVVRDLRTLHCLIMEKSPGDTL